MSNLNNVATIETMGFVPMSMMSILTAPSELKTDSEVKYDIPRIKQFLKENEDDARVAVNIMFRNNENYAENMNESSYERLACVFILQGDEYSGCDTWNKRLAEAKKKFIAKSESVVTKDTIKDAIKDSINNVINNIADDNTKKFASKIINNENVKYFIDGLLDGFAIGLADYIDDVLESEPVEEDVKNEIVPVISQENNNIDITDVKKALKDIGVNIEMRDGKITFNTNSKQQVEKKQKPQKQNFNEVDTKEKIIDVEPKDVTNVVEFDTNSTFIPSEPKSDSSKKDALIETTEKPQSDDASGKMKKVINKVRQVIESVIPQQFGVTFNVTGDLIYMTLFSKVDNQYIATFEVDPYNVYGNRIYVKVASEVGYVDVPLERKDLLMKTIGSNLLLTKDEAFECSKYIFFNRNIYNIVDMSGIKAFKEMPLEKYSQLGQKLEKVLFALDKYINGLPRFRFKEFTNNNKFILIADGKVKNPRHVNEYTHSTVNIVVTVNGDDIVITDGEDSRSIKIDDKTK